MQDQHWLYSGPEFHNAVQWSEDNLIAVAAGRTVVILSPSDLSGPRNYITIKPELNPLVLGCIPEDHANSIPLSILCSTELRFKEAASTVVRAVSWSPIGCSSSGGCVLAVLDNSNQVL